MTDYRCYCLDRFGCIRAVTALAADSDERARASAAVLLTTCAHDRAEIWQGRRHVCTVEARRAAPQRRAPTRARPARASEAAAPEAMTSPTTSPPPQAQ